MVTLIFRFFLALNGIVDDRSHELLHRACEISVYAIVAPTVPDDATTPTGEAVAELLCRGDEL